MEEQKQNETVANYSGSKPPRHGQTQPQPVKGVRANANKIKKILDRSGTGGDDPLDDDDTEQTELVGVNFNDFQEEDQYLLTKIGSRQNVKRRSSKNSVESETQHQNKLIQQIQLSTQQTAPNFEQPLHQGFMELKGAKKQSNFSTSGYQRRTSETIPPNSMNAPQLLQDQRASNERYSLVNHTIDAGASEVIEKTGSNRE